jgi:hypothetical protein
MVKDVKGTRSSIIKNINSAFAWRGYGNPSRGSRSFGRDSNRPEALLHEQAYSMSCNLGIKQSIARGANAVLLWAFCVWSPVRSWLSVRSIHSENNPSFVGLHLLGQESGELSHYRAGLRCGWLRFDARQGKIRSVQTGLGLNQPPLPWAPGAISHGGGGGLSGLEVKLTTRIHLVRGPEWWKYIPTPPFVLTAYQWITRTTLPFIHIFSDTMPYSPLKDDRRFEGHIASIFNN